MKHLNRVLFLSLVCLLCLLMGEAFDLARGPVNRKLLLYFDVCPDTSVSSVEKDMIVTQIYVNFKGQTVTYIWQLHYRDAPTLMRTYKRPMPHVCVWPDE